MADKEPDVHTSSGYTTNLFKHVKGKRLNKVGSTHLYVTRSGDTTLVLD